jgi:succinate dehydrogenase / fumarate reductase flavoprotein subunit
MMKNNLRTNVTNILVIGSGGAGLRAAIAAHEKGAEVVALGKRLRKDAHTVLAAGGINAALATVDAEDTWQQHFADTLKEGYFLGDPLAVDILTREAPELVNELDYWGCDFNRTPSGEIDQRFFGAHKYRRTCYAGDYTGRAILNTLVDKVEELGIPIHENQYVWRLLVHDKICFGAMAFNIQSGERTAYLADAVILAAGGHARIWRWSSSRRDENTGDGVYLALQAGCRVADMELVQFHPTGMLWPENMAGTLVTEAVRGEGGHLLNNQGERYMRRYDPERMELSTRDLIALANYKEIQEGHHGPHGGVFLDISHKDKKTIIEKLPRMYRQFMETQLLDISKDKMEVAPTAHYSMGGVVVDPDTHKTDIDGLYAAGEVTSGVHGANRLGGNSLAEILVFGKRAGQSAADYSTNLSAQIRNQAVIQNAQVELDMLTKPGEELARPLQRALRINMWENCGVVRDKVGLLKGLEFLEELKASSKLVDVRPDAMGFLDLAIALDLRGSIIAAEATMRSALAREESRGAHQRTDFPEINQEFNINIQIQLEGEKQVLHLEPVNAVPNYLESWIEDTSEISIVGRLLE